MAAKGLLLFAFLGFLQCQVSFQFLFRRRSCTNKWDKLTVKFLRYHDIPMTEDAAKSAGWFKPTSLACDGHSYFVGNRYMNQKADATMALYDSDGIIAGIQASLPATTIFPANFSNMLPSDGGRRHITAYFTEPSTICTKGRSRQKGCVGEKLIIQNGLTPSSLLRIPLTEDKLTGTKWTHGQCFVGMGEHYWYNLSKNMDCNNFFPVFLLYNDRKLNAFGWAFGGDAKSDWFEHPPVKYLDYFFQPETKPQCLSDYAMRSTQHIFFESSSLKYIC